MHSRRGSPRPGIPRRQHGAVTHENLGGYRILRKLGEGPRAEVLLGHPDTDQSGTDQSGAAPASTGRPDGSSVALKIYRPTVPDESILGEIEALSRASGPHVVDLLDVTTAASGAPALILQRLVAGSLGRLLADRDRLTAGEAITVLAPIAEAVNRIHRAGVVHGALSADAVLFDTAGAPVLARFGRAGCISQGLPDARLEHEPGVTGDRRAFDALAAAVLARVDGVDPAPLLSGGLGEFVDRIFDLSEPEAVDFRARRPELAPVVASRLFSAGPVPEEPVSRGLRVGGSRQGSGTDGQRSGPRAGIASGTLAAVALPDRADAFVSHGRDTVARVLRGLAQVRTRVWVLAGGVAVAILAAALLLVPRSPQEQPRVVVPPSPVTSAPVGTAVLDDDPVAAAAALLEGREACIRDLSVQCLDAIDQQGSTALASDVALVRSIREGAEFPVLPAPGELALVERLGDSAIVSLGVTATSTPDSTPASVLLMKGEAGWRIRDYLVE